MWANVNYLFIINRMQQKWWDATSEIRLQKKKKVTSILLALFHPLACLLWGRLVAMLWPMWWRKLREKLREVSGQQPVRMWGLRSIRQWGIDFCQQLCKDLEVGPTSVKPLDEAAALGNTLIVAVRDLEIQASGWAVPSLDPQKLWSVYCFKFIILGVICYKTTYN